MTSRDRKVPLSSKAAFGIGQTGESMLSMGLNLFTLYYYNAVLGISGSAAGIAIAFSLVFDAVTDPLCGSVSDNWRSRWGRRHPFMYAAGLPLGLVFFGLFSPPSGLDATGLLVWLFTFLVLTRAALTLYHVPHLSLGAELTENFEERSWLAASRQILSIPGMAIAAWLGYRWYAIGGSGDDPEAYAAFGGTLGVLIAVTILLSALGTHKEIPHLPLPPEREPGSVFGKMLRETGSALRIASFRWIFSGILLVYLMFGIDTVLSNYVFEYFWELDGSQKFILLVLPMIGMLPGALLVVPVHRRFGKRSALILGTVGWALGQALPVVLRLVDWFPENGTSSLFWSLAIFRFGQGLIMSQARISFDSMMADVTDEHELESGRRSEGIFFGAVAFSSKAANGLSAAIAGWALDLIGWPAGASAQGTVIPADTIFRLGLVYGPFLVGMSFVSSWCYTHYRIDRVRHTQILEQLAVQRKRDAG